MKARDLLLSLGRESLRALGLLVAIVVAVAALASTMAGFPASLQVYEWFVDALLVLCFLVLVWTTWLRLRPPPPPEPTRTKLPPGSGEGGAGGAPVPARLPPGPRGPLVGAAAKALPLPTEEHAPCFRPEP